MYEPLLIFATESNVCVFREAWPKRVQLRSFQKDLEKAVGNWGHALIVNAKMMLIHVSD